MDFQELFRKGGILMWPILAMSIIAVMFAIERLFGMRTGRVLPGGLLRELGRIGDEPRELDLRAVYQACQKYPSAAANVIRSALLKVGRPHSEIESAISQASQREAIRLLGNVRPIQLAVTISPLLGLLGTVQGMIDAFFKTANMPTGSNRIEYLAQGIYTALITTFAGLCVAIPAAVVVHYFEGRAQRLLLRIDELLLSLLPHLEKYEGRLRVTKRDTTASPQARATPAVAAVPAAGEHVS
jgi:biopolymer transport protein ExbB